MLPWIFFFVFINESSRSVGEVLVWIVRIVPSFALGFGILNISNRILWTRVYDRDMSERNEKFSTFKIHYVGAGTDMLYLFITCIAFTLLVFLVEIL